MKSPRVESNVDDNDFQDEDIVMITRKYRRVFNKPSERRRFKDFKRENCKWEKKEWDNYLFWVQKSQSCNALFSIALSE